MFASDMKLPNMQIELWQWTEGLYDAEWLDNKMADEIKCWCKQINIHRGKTTLILHRHNDGLNYLWKDSLDSLYTALSKNVIF